MMRHVLLTGLPGVGKTTLIREVARRLARHYPAGFYTEEMRVQGMRKGFRLVCLDGRQQVLSHVDYPGPARVGRYGVDVSGFERLLVELDLCHSPSRLIVIDEIGKMECFSQRFREDVTALLDSPRTVLATIALKGEGLIAHVRQRSDCRPVTVTGDNREHLVDKLVAEVRERLATAQSG